MDVGVVCQFWVKQFAMCLGVVGILLLWMCLVCVVVLRWHVWSSKECVCCACDPNKRVCVCVFVCRKLSPHLGV